MSNKLYAERDVMAQGQYYLDHINAMTGEGLHSKSAIAAELAHRDIEIESLTAKLAETQEQYATAHQQGLEEGKKLEREQWISDLMKIPDIKRRVLEYVSDDQQQEPPK